MRLHHLPKSTAASVPCWVMAGLLGVALASPATLAGGPPLSDCIYRIPYEIDPGSGEYVQVHSSNVLQDGHNGYDLFGKPAIPWGGDPGVPPVGYPLVAAGDGIVRRVEDVHVGCCKNCTACNNKVWIEHPNGEFTVYYHIAPDSARVFPGQPVFQGHYIADEGDTGATCSCGGGPQNRPNPGCYEDPQGAVACDSEEPCPYCSVHLHFSLFQDFLGTVEDYATLNPDHFDHQAQPRICNIDNGIMEPGEEYSDGSDNGVVGDCDPAINTDCPMDLFLGKLVYFSGDSALQYAESTIIVQNVILDTQGDLNACVDQDDCSFPALCAGGFCHLHGAAVALRAGDSITLQPGVHARTSSYLHASIGPCYGCDP